MQDDLVVVLTFDTREHLDAWLASDERRRILAEMERHTIGARTFNVVGGFAGWFGMRDGHDVKRWKSAATVLLALVPVSGCSSPCACGCSPTSTSSPPPCCPTSSASSC